MVTVEMSSKDALESYDKHSNDSTGFAPAQVRHEHLVGCENEGDNVHRTAVIKVKITQGAYSKLRKHAFFEAR